MVSKFLDPKNDVAFKKIFGTEKNKNILIHFINDMLCSSKQTKRKPVVDITFLKTNQDPDIAAHKTSIVDVLCRDTEGVNYIVEMQVAKEKGFEKRAQFYAAKTYSSQLLVAGKYYDLKEVIFLAISDKILFPDKKGHKSTHTLRDEETNEQDLKGFSFTFLELEKFHKTIDELKTIQEKWLYFFKHAEETSAEDLEKIIGKDLAIGQAYTALESYSWSEEDLRTYEQWEKYEGAYIASMDQKYDEGEAKGLVKGEAVGLAKGEAVGLAKGEAKAKIEMAGELLKEGMSIESVCKITKLSKQDLLNARLL